MPNMQYHTHLGEEIRALGLLEVNEEITDLNHHYLHPGLQNVLKLLVHSERVVFWTKNKCCNNFGDK